MTKQRHNILIVNGPGLNMLGVGTDTVGGAKSLSAIALECEDYASELGFSIDFRQSNSEGDIISILQEAQNACAGVVINPAAYGHTSLALQDALKSCGLPAIEVQLGNVHATSTRGPSLTSAAVQGVICGFGSHGYLLALNALRALLDDE